jgi:Translation initiation factor IF-2, N-terminal region
LSFDFSNSGGHVPGNTRVSALAKELGITSMDALTLLTELGEYVKSASSTVEAPAADALRRRCGGSDRPGPAVTPTAGWRRGGHRNYPRNNPYMDLGKTEIDHLQAADHAPQGERAPRAPRRSAPRPPGANEQQPGPPAPLVVQPRRPRRDWYRDAEPSEFDRHVLDRIIVPRRDEYSRPPQPPWRYFEDEVHEARDITARWMPLLLHGMDYEEILDWRECLDPLSTRSFIVEYADAPEDAIALHTAGVTPRDLRWRPEDHGWGTLPDRLRRCQMSVDEVITEVGYRRAEDTGR